ncbi:MAG: single-stranded-DNA-specific exonuclease RecJ, partial [Flavobacteriales bacterium]|nr:single-stranded-DNA-specific exonuclease RecJ [Flavobacteriales bacterium]
DVRTMGADESHLRFKPAQQSVKHLMLQAVAFKMGKLYPQLAEGKPFDMAYTIEENHWKDKVYLQLNVKDLKFR